MRIVIFVYNLCSFKHVCSIRHVFVRLEWNARDLHKGG